MEPPTKSWSSKFANALRGVSVGIKGGKTNSFLVHIPAAFGVIVAAFLIGVSRERLLILLLCISIVLMAELFNSSLESLAKAITADDNEHIRDALDIASGAVLVASLFAVLIGALVFL